MRRVGEVFRKHHGHDPLERKLKKKRPTSERLAYGECIAEMWEIEEEIADR